MIATTVSTAPQALPEINLKVLDGIELKGHINTSDEQLIANITANIRRGLPQIRPQGLQTDRVCLVGSGPSLAQTETELVQLVHEGAKLVTVNGAYHWCLARNLRPSAQIVMDARPENVRFLHPEVPRCHYLLASQCHPSAFDAIVDRPNAWIFHCMNAENQGKPILDAYYLGHWQCVEGGTTVTGRALVALRMMGYLRFDLFGVDSCFIDGAHHALPQPENANDDARATTLRISPIGHPEIHREFRVAPWHVKQLEDMLQFMRVHGDQVLINVHGDGLIAYAIRAGAELAIDEV